MSNNQKPIESDLPGFYYDEVKKKYYRITPAHLSNPLHPEKIRRIEGHRGSSKTKEELVKLKTVSITQAVGRFQGAGPSRGSARSFQSNVLASAMAQLSEKFSSEVLEDFEDQGRVIGNAVMSISGNGKICTSFSMKPSGLAVVGSEINFREQSAQHGLTELFYVHKVVDMKHTTISDGDFVAVACQALGRDAHIVKVSPIFMDRMLDRHTKNFEFPTNETIWSIAVSSKHLSVGMERKIEMFTTEESAKSTIKVPGENVFVLETDGDDRLLVGTNKGNVHTIDTRSNNIESTVKVGAALSNLKISNNHLVASAYDHKLMLFDKRNTEKALATLNAHQNDCRPHLSLQLHDRLNIVAATGSDNAIRMWSLTDFQLASTISDERFVSSDIPPCFVIDDSWGPPCAVAVASGSRIACYA